MDGIRIDPTVYEGRPAEAAGRQKKELAVYNLLDGLRVSYRRLDHDPTPTVDCCHRVESLLGIEICKNLFLCDSGKSDFYLLMMPGEKRFKTGELSRQLGCSRLSFAPPEYMEALLNVTPGSATVLGLMNDRENRVRLVIDREVLKGEYVGCHPCVNTSSLRLRCADLTEKILPALGHQPVYVEL